MSASERTGRCLCGAVSIHATPATNRAVACHCRMCRTWGGGPLFAVDCGTDVRLEGEEHVALFRSSDWAERAFCKACGTHLFYRLVATGEHEVPVGLLGDGDWSFDQQIFVDDKPAFYAFANATTNLTGAEVFARYSSDTEE